MKTHSSTLLHRPVTRTYSQITLLQQSFSYLYQRRLFFVIGALVLFLLFIFFGFVKMIIILGSLVICTVILSFICRGIPYIGRSFELIMFTSVIAGTCYGPKIGALFGAITAILYYFAAGRLSIHVAVFAPLYALVGVAASQLNIFPIFFVGMVLTITYTLISSVIVVFGFGGRLEKALIFLAMNLFFNFFLFKYIAPLILMIA